MLEALGVTLGVALVVWFLYGSGVLKVTSTTYRVVFAATFGAPAFYGFLIVLMLLGGPNLDESGGLVGIAVSLVLAAVAASNFLLDLDRVEQLIAQGAGGEYDWHMAFSMLLSLIWLYLEVLRIPSKLRRQPPSDWNTTDTPAKLPPLPLATPNICHREAFRRAAYYGEAAE